MKRKANRSSVLAVSSLLLVVLIVAALGWLRTRTSEGPSPRGEHSTVANDAREPVEVMPAQSDGGALEQELAKPLAFDLSTIEPGMSEIEAERGFVSFEDIVSMDEHDGDPYNVRERYSTEELLGGYQRRFVGNGAIAEVQVSVLRFEKEQGAADELEFGITEMTANDLMVDTSALQSPSVLARAPGVAGGRDVEASVLSWTSARDLYTVVVLADDGDYGQSIALQIANTIGA